MRFTLCMLLFPTVLAGVLITGALSAAEPAGVDKSPVKDPDLVITETFEDGGEYSPFTVYWGDGWFYDTYYDEWYFDSSYDPYLGTWRYDPWSAAWFFIYYLDTADLDNDGYADTAVALMMNNDGISVAVTSDCSVYPEFSTNSGSGGMLTAHAFLPAAILTLFATMRIKQR